MWALVLPLQVWGMLGSFRVQTVLPEFWRWLYFTAGVLERRLGRAEWKEGKKEEGWREKGREKERRGRKREEGREGGKGKEKKDGRRAGRKTEKRERDHYCTQLLLWVHAWLYNTDPSSDCNLKGVGVVGVTPLWWMGVPPSWVCLDLLAGVVGVVWEATRFWPFCRAARNGAENWNDCEAKFCGWRYPYHPLLVLGSGVFTDEVIIFLILTKPETCTQRSHQYCTRNGFLLLYNSQVSHIVYCVHHWTPAASFGDSLSGARGFTASGTQLVGRIDI